MSVKGIQEMPPKKIYIPFFNSIFCHKENHIIFQTFRVGFVSMFPNPVLSKKYSQCIRRWIRDNELEPHHHNTHMPVCIVLPPSQKGRGPTPCRMRMQGQSVSCGGGGLVKKTTNRQNEAIGHPPSIMCSFVTMLCVYFLSLKIHHRINIHLCESNAVLSVSPFHVYGMVLAQ